MTPDESHYLKGAPHIEGCVGSSGEPVMGQILGKEFGKEPGRERRAVDFQGTIFLTEATFRFTYNVVGT
jgi:hypothetical protein